MNTKNNFSKANTLLSTTIILTATTLFSRAIIVYYNVYISGRIGTLGIGVFELIMSIYTFAKTAATAGVSLASTRISAENIAMADALVKKILAYCFTVGVICCSILFSLSNPICTNLLSNPPGGADALKILSFSLPFLSMTAGFNGYFIAKRIIRLYAPIQIFEQITRIAITIYFLEKISINSLELSIKSIALAITISEILSLLFSELFFLFTKTQKTAVSHMRGFIHQFNRLVLPVGGGAIFRSSLNTIYNLLVPRGLKKSGTSNTEALAAYGTVQGMALPIILYPSTLMSVLSMQLVPEIAFLNANNRVKNITYITKRVSRITLIFSIICAGTLFYFSDEFSNIIFLKSLSPLIPVMYLDTVTDGILKGMDLQIKVLGIGIIDSLLSLSLIYLLLPKFAITGYIFTIYVGETINTLLGQIELRKHIKIHISLLKDIIMPIGCISFSIFICRYYLGSNVNINSPLSLTFLVVSTIFLCGFMLVVTKTISPEEIQWCKNLFRANSKSGLEQLTFLNTKKEQPIRTRTDHNINSKAGKANKLET